MTDLALQMYTVRDQFAAAPRRCLHDVAQAGFTAVEFAGFGDLSPTELRAALDAEGLRAISSHIDIPFFETELDRVVDDHLAMGCSYVVIQQAAVKDFSSAADVSALAARCNEWGRTLAAAGLRLGYHGYHDFDNEFAMDDGVRRWDRFVAETDPRYVDIQLDTYWVQFVGDDPVEALHRLRDRVPMLHAKDMRIDRSGDTPVGTGRTPWPEVLAAAVATGVEWIVVEQENDPANAIRDIEVSRRNLLSVLESHATERVS